MDGGRPISRLLNMGFFYVIVKTSLPAVLTTKHPGTWLLQSSCRRCVVTSFSTSRLLYSVLASSSSTAAGVSGMAAEMRNYTAVVSNTQQNCGVKYYLEQQHGVLQRDDQDHLLAPRHVREHAVHGAGQAWAHSHYIQCLLHAWSHL